MASTYRELRVWRAGIRLVEDVYEITIELPNYERNGLASQLQRSAVSIPSNIAEGFRRNGDKEYRRFLDIALGSAGELDTQLEILGRVYPNILVAEIQAKLSITTNSLLSFRSSLRTSDIGPRT